VIVVDASAVVPLLLDPAAGTAGLRARLAEEPVVHAPHLLDVEVANALRRQLLGDRLTACDAVYVALAEALGSHAGTRHARLARTGGHRARVELR
jgi:predicted nucleic acid-binding protein